MFTKENASELGKRGSRKGIPNKNTAEARKLMLDVLHGELSTTRLQEALKDVYGKSKERYLYLLLALSKQVLPTLQHIKIDDATKPEEITEIKIITSQDVDIEEETKDKK